MQKDSLLKSKKGMSTILIVILVGVSSLIMAQGATLLSLRELDAGLLSSIGRKSLYVAEACTEEAMLRILNESSYAATSEMIVVDDCSCTYSIDASANERIIWSEGTCSNHTIGIKLTLDVSTGVDLNKWEFQ